jgi:hypothetical protein
VKDAGFLFKVKGKTKQRMKQRLGQTFFKEKALLIRWIKACSLVSEKMFACLFKYFLIRTPRYSSFHFKRRLDSSYQLSCSPPHANETWIALFDTSDLDFIHILHRGCPYSSALVFEQLCRLLPSRT